MSSRFVPVPKRPYVRALSEAKKPHLWSQPPFWGESATTKRRARDCALLEDLATLRARFRRMPANETDPELLGAIHALEDELGMRRTRVVAAVA